MKKLEDFVRWTKLKIRVHLSKSKIYFKEREIWWASLGANIGFEQDGKHEMFERPVLVVKKFNHELLWIVPLTSQIKEGKFYFKIEYNSKMSIIVR